MFEIADNAEKSSKDFKGAKIRVVGVGGAGGNAVNTMISSGLTGVEYIAANTDIQALDASLATIKVQLGRELTKGLGAGANPDIGRKAALEEYEYLSELLTDADMVFITAGMGGGTGTGAAPVIAKLAKELGALTVGVVTKPFLFEGKKRSRQAESGMNSLEEAVDSLITIPNQRLLALAGENLSLIETFKRADEVLLNAVRGISDLINHTGLINADFADVSTVMGSKGLALMGTGVASGPDRAIKAATEAIQSPLLEDVTIDGATGIIINITGSRSLTTFETNAAVTLIMEAADEEAEIIFGTVIDDNMGDFVKVTVVATGLGNDRNRKKMSLSATNDRSAIYADRITSTVRQQNPTSEREISMPASKSNVGLQALSEGGVGGGSGSSRSEERATEKEKQESSNHSEPHYGLESRGTSGSGLSAPVLEETQVGSEVLSRKLDSSTEGSSTLAESIRRAASSYEEAVNSGHLQKRFSNNGGDEAKSTFGSNRVHQASGAGSGKSNLINSVNDEERNKAKSIAERLGFINFSDEEFDTPTFLRKDINSSSSTFTEN